MQFFQEKENQVSHSFDSQSHISTVMKKIPPKSKHKLQADLFVGT